MYKGIELRYFHYAVALAEELNYHRAAERLNITQPTLSAQIRDLEDQLGVQLFLRSKVRVKLTHAGKEFSRIAKRILAEERKAIHAAKAAQNGTNHTFRMAYSPYVTFPFVHRVQTLYQQTFPQGGIDLISGFTSKSLERLLDGDVDAALVTLPVKNPEIEVQILTREKLLVCLAANHRLASKNILHPADLQDETWVCFHEHYHPSLYRTIFHHLHSVGLAKRTPLHITTMEEKRFSVARGAGIALLRESSVVEPSLVLKPLNKFNLYVETGYARLRSTQWRPVLAFADTLAHEFSIRPAVQEPLPFVPATSKRPGRVAVSRIRMKA